MNRFVVDCNVVVSWFLADEFCSYSERVQKAMMLNNYTAIVPTLWLSEITNVLFQSEKRKRITENQAHLAIHELSLLPFEVDTMNSLQNMNHVLTICRQHHLTAYDASYAELCVREHVPLATMDKALCKAAKKMGIKIF